MVTQKAYAKINLSLDITGKRDNGYHDVNMVMQSIDLYDTLSLDTNEEGRLILKTDNDTLNAEANEGNDNLIIKAARAILNFCQRNDGISISLNKRIPIAAGMAGGSSDAAATLRGINELLNLNLSDETLCEIGVKIGADVPFCIMGHTMQSQGIGEILTPLKTVSGMPVLICKPPIAVSTKEVYTRYDALKSVTHPDVSKMVEAIENGDLSKIPSLAGNVLEQVTAPLYPVIRDIEEEMLKNGAEASIMSGSGPTVFGIFDDECTLRKAYEAIALLWPSYETFTVKTL